ncbi:MAG TPA: glycosyltransferase family 39 protein, partial [Myxococcaceae bacterium]|nr:glycosyltransferase family 39 protein [Myxococcaceae bacterium]
MSFKIIHSAPGSQEARRWTVGRKAFASALVLLVGAGVAARVLALPRLLPDLDAVNFARALDAFNLSAQAPHFPGYPVYVALARLAAEAVAPEVVALALPGLVLGAVAIAALALVLRSLLGPAGALVGAALVALLPLPVLFGATPGSDGVGLALLVLAACAVLRTGASSLGATVLAGLVAGVALGARPSFLPALLGLALVVPRGHRRSALAGAG